MNDENATPSEKEALLWEVFDSSAAIEEGMELKDEKNGEANKDSSPKSEKEVEKSPEQEKGEKSTTKEEPGKYSKKDYLPVPEPIRSGRHEAWCSGDPGEASRRQEGRTKGMSNIQKDGFFY